MESVVIQGDLARLQREERVSYYRSVCESLGLNPLTKPFEYLMLNNRLTLYARKDATDQLRASRGISSGRSRSGTRSRSGSGSRSRASSGGPPAAAVAALGAFDRNDRHASARRLARQRARTSHAGRVVARRHR